MKKEVRWVDRQFELFGILAADVQSEGQYQVTKWGMQDRTPFEWLAYLTEEVGELSEAISEACYRRGPWSSVYHEAIQTATLALKMAEMADGQIP